MGLEHVIYGCGALTPRNNARPHTREKGPGWRDQDTKMDEEEPQSTSSNDRGQNPLVAKRAASQDPDPASKAKRIKTSHGAQNESDVQPPAITRVAVPFPEKVCMLLLSSGGRDLS